MKMKKEQATRTLQILRNIEKRVMSVQLAAANAEANNTVNVSQMRSEARSILAAAATLVDALEPGQ